MRYVALLRGINVGGKAVIRMADLRECASGLGLEDVSTYIASGNLLFRTSRCRDGALEASLEEALHALRTTSRSGRSNRFCRPTSVAWPRS